MIWFRFVLCVVHILNNVCSSFVMMDLGSIYRYFYRSIAWSVEAGGHFSCVIAQ